MSILPKTDIREHLSIIDLPRSKKQTIENVTKFLSIAVRYTVRIPKRGAILLWQQQIQSEKKNKYAHYQSIS